MKPFLIYYICLEPWILTFKYDAKRFFNGNITVDNTTYDKVKMEKVKPQDDLDWKLKLTYHGYPEIELPTIIWKQSSNPFVNTAVVEGFQLVENNLQG